MVRAIIELSVAIIKSGVPALTFGAKFLDSLRIFYGHLLNHWALADLFLNIFRCGGRICFKLALVCVSATRASFNLVRALVAIVFIFFNNGLKSICTASGTNGWVIIMSVAEIFCLLNLTGYSTLTRTLSEETASFTFFKVHHKYHTPFLLVYREERRWKC